MGKTDADMQEVFRHLNEKNREIVMVVAQSLKTVQDVAQESCQAKNPPPDST